MADESQSDLFGVAIVGMHARVPGAPDLNSFWDLVRTGGNGITDFPIDGLDASVSDRDRMAPSYVRSRGVIEHADCFDAAYFGVPPNEATVMDPQQRIFLEGCHAALEHAGHSPQSCDGQIGVYAGMANNTYFPNHVQRNPDSLEKVGEFQVMLANEKDFLATRVAHRLGLKGPAISLYTGCSTSLVAVCQAFTALMSYQCDLALAGGVTLTTPQASGYHHAEGGIEAADGRCRPFDEQATGTVFSNGIGVVALRRLEDAVDEGDHILAVIRGIGLNNDGGGKVSFAAPTVEGQAGAVELALGQADIGGHEIDFIEAHGTGTQLGDPIELAGLRRALGPRAGSAPCLIGSVKGNFGHLLAAAGVVGLIKTVLALENGAVPPMVHFNKPNPQLGLEDGLFEINTALRELSGPEPHRAGVSSFGIGGTNAHVVVESWPKTLSSGHAGQSPEVLMLSADSREQLDQYRHRLISALKAAKFSVGDVAYTLRVSRAARSWRLAILASSNEEACESLKSAKLVETQPIAESVSVTANPEEQKRQWLAGAALDTEEGRGDHRKVPLPTYPFARTRYWLDTPEEQDRQTIAGDQAESSAKTVSPVLPAAAPENIAGPTDEDGFLRALKQRRSARLGRTGS